MELADEPILNIRGEKVVLGPHRRELLPLYTRWINDFEVTRTLAARMRPMTLDAETEWYDRISRADPGQVLFTIYERASLQPIGVTGLHDIHSIDGTAEFGILIGEKEHWGRGCGTESARLMLDYGFTLLGLQNIMLTVYAYNERGLRAYQRAGFREFGRRRAARRLGAERYDLIYMECLTSEFQGSAFKYLLPEA